MLNLIPLPYRILGFIAIVVSVFFFGYNKGASSQQTAYEIRAQKDAITYFQKGVESVKVTEKVVVEYKDKIIERIKIVNKTKEVINEQISADDVVPVGFVRVHDKSITNQNGDAAGSIRVDEKTSAISSVDLRTAAEVIVDNYGTCYQWKDQLESLQDWVLKQQELYPASQ